MITRSPISACVIEALGPIAQSRPIFTFAPIAAPAPITVPEPISARGPMTAPGSTVAPLSSRALGWIKAPGATPSASNSDDGRNASG